MQIAILECTRRHGVTDDEIRAVLSYPVFRIRIAPRQEGSDPYLFIGSYDEDEPLIEVIADLADPDKWIAFHAMMLRPATIQNLRLEMGLELVVNELDLDNIVRQRPERRKGL
ncbi:hypothetical protein [Nocardia callitridis]|uniref:Uncharacterized protein n=1 Tax=Nocardia callitridis TaxID=648753 RepID=A0ABP9KZG8_9NOCA